MLSPSLASPHEVPTRSLLTHMPQVEMALEPPEDSDLAFVQLLITVIGLVSIVVLASTLWRPHLRRFGRTYHRIQSRAQVIV